MQRAVLWICIDWSPRSRASARSTQPLSSIAASPGDNAECRRGRRLVMSRLGDSLAARGYLNPVAVVNESEDRLRALQPEARAAFAVLCAQRVMDSHLRLPSSEQQPFTLSWAPVLREIWAGLGDPKNLSARARVESHLKSFYEGPFHHDPGGDGPHGADEDAAAASIYAAETFCRDEVQPARWAASRLIDATGRLVLAERAGLARSTWEEFAHPLQQRVAHGLLKALRLLESQPWTPDLIPKLRASFE